MNEARHEMSGIGPIEPVTPKALRRRILSVATPQRAAKYRRVCTPTALLPRIQLNDELLVYDRGNFFP
jgi:hypothetical protein